MIAKQMPNSEHTLNVVSPFLGVTLQPIVAGTEPFDLSLLPLNPTTWDEADMVHPHSIELANQAIPLMHYMPTRYFLTLLNSSRFHMGLVSRQDKDANDGSFPDANALAPVGLNELFYQGFPTNRDVNELVEQNEFSRQLTYIHCWFNSAVEDAKMWYNFADEARGVALCVASNRLVEAVVKSPEEYHLSIDRVRYVDNNTQLVEFIPSLPILRKDPKFLHEREVRLCAELMVPVDGSIEPHTLERYRPFEVDLTKCITEIITGPLMSDGLHNKIEEKIKAKLPAARVSKSGFKGRWFSGGWGEQHEHV